MKTAPGRRWLRRAGWALLGLVLVVVDGVLALATSEGHELCRAMVEVALTEGVEGRVALGTFDVTLGGHVALGDLRVSGPAGEEVLHVERVEVDLGTLSPGPAGLLLRRVLVSGVHVFQGEGKPRLAQIFKPPPPPDGAPPTDLKVDAITLEGVNVEVLQPDGTLLRLREGSLTGSLAVTEGTATFDLRSGKTRSGKTPGSLTVKRPNGGRFELSDLRWSLGGQAGPTAFNVKIAPVDWPLRAEVPELGLLEGQLAFRALEVSGGLAGASVRLDGLKVLDATLERFEGQLRLGPKWTLQGDQELELVGFQIPEHIINRLAKKQAVQGPVTLNLKGHGSAAAVVVRGSIASSLGDLTLSGTLNVTAPARPVFDLKFEGSKLGPARPHVLAQESSDVEVRVKGAGILPGEIDGTLVCHIKAARFGLPIKSIVLQGTSAGDHVDFVLKALGQELKFKAKKLPDSALFQALLTTQIKLPTLIEKLQEEGILQPGSLAISQGSLDLHLTLEGEAPTPDTEVPDFRVHGSVDLGPVTTSLGSLGSARLKLDVSVRKLLPYGHLRLTLHDLKVGPQYIQRLTLDLDLQGEHAELSLDLDLPLMGRVVSLKLGADRDRLTGDVDAVLHALKVTHGPLEVALDTPLKLHIPGDFSLLAKGFTLPTLRLQVSGGWVEVSGDLDFEESLLPAAQGPPPKLSGWDIKLRLQGLKPRASLPPGLRWTAGRSPILDGHLHLTGSPADPRLAFGLTTRLGRLRVATQGTLKEGALRARGTITRPKGKTVVRWRFRAPVDLAQNMPLGRMKLDWDIDRLRLADIITSTPTSFSPLASLKGNGYLSGTLRSPEGVWNLRVTSPKFDGMPALRLNSQGRLENHRGEVQLRVRNHLKLGAFPSVPSQLELTFQRSPLLHPNTPVEGWWTLQPPDLSAWTQGEIRGRLGLKGTFKKRGGRLQATAEAWTEGLRLPAIKGPIHLASQVELTHQGLRLSGEAKVGKRVLASWKGGVKGNLLGAAKRGRLGRLPLELSWSAPRTSFGALGELLTGLSPTGLRQLQAMSGDVGGEGRVTGTVAQPTLAATWSAAGYTTVDRGQGHVKVDVSGSVKGLKARVRVGKAGSEGLLAGDLSLRLGDDGNVRGQASLGADRAPLASVLPAALLFDVARLPGGTLAGGWKAGFDVDMAAGKVRSTGGEGTLRLAFDNLAIPGTGRTFKTLRGALSLRPDGLEISSFRLIEADPQEPNRQLSLTGKLHWRDFKPTRFSGEMVLSQWLSAGPLDAPQAIVDATIGLEADLDRVIPKFLVDFKSLTHTAPNRFLRDHYQETFGENDVVFIDDESQVGTLPPAESLVFLTFPEPGTGQPLKVPFAVPSLDLELRFSQPALVDAAPLVLSFTGAVKVGLRPDGVTTSGGLDVQSGSLSLFGFPFGYQRGNISLDGPISNARVNLTFARKPGAWMCRDNAQPGKTCPPVEVTLDITPLGGVNLVFGGPSGPSMIGAMALQNGGHGQYLSGPGKSSSSTLQFPQAEDLMVISWVATNAAQLSLLDRYGAHSDPTTLATYGQLTRYEAQRFLAGGTQRLRLHGRPRAGARNGAEFAYDLLLKNTGRNRFGVGFHTGNELYTGAELFFEWSTKR